MSNTNTGGPAFPIKGPVMTSDEQGMTLRDYFAAKAMQAYIQRAVLEMDMEDVVADAYAMADAMLKARNT